MFSQLPSAEFAEPADRSDADVAAMQCEDGAAGYVDIVARLLTATFGGGNAEVQSKAAEASGEARDPFAGTS